MIVLVSCDAFFCQYYSGMFSIDSLIFMRSTDELNDRHRVSEKDVAILDLKYLPPSRIADIICPVIVLSPYPRFEEAVELLKLNVKGYGNRMMHPDNLRKMIESVKAGQIWVPSDILSKIIRALPADAEKEPQTEFDLSEREEQVAKLVAMGKSNPEIADELGISVRTVKAHLTSIFGKSGLRDRLAVALHYSK